MKRGFSFVALASAALALLGCKGEPKPDPVSRLSFPVVLVTGTKPNNEVAHRARVMASADELGHMRVELYSGLSDPTRNDPPIVIDSKAAIYDMKEIKGEHGGLWMMANPTGMMPIQFKLVPREESGLEVARTLVLACTYLDYVMDSDQREQRRERIRRAVSMQEIAAAVGEPPEPTPIP